MAPDGTLYAVDSIFGEKVLEKFGAPYHFDPCTALKTIEKLHDTMGRYDAVQPSHGPLLKGGEAEKVIEANRNAVRRLLDLVREALERGYTLDEAARHVARGMNAPSDPGLLLLVQATVHGALACLHAKGEADPRTENGLVRWFSVRALQAARVQNAGDD